MQAGRRRWISVIERSLNVGQFTGATPVFDFRQGASIEHAPVTFGGAGRFGRGRFVDLAGFSLGHASGGRCSLGCGSVGDGDGEGHFFSTCVIVVVRVVRAKIVSNEEKSLRNAS